MQRPAIGCATNPSRGARSGWSVTGTSRRARPAWRHASSPLSAAFPLVGNRRNGLRGSVCGKGGQTSQALSGGGQPRLLPVSGGLAPPCPHSPSIPIAHLTSRPPHSSALPWVKPRGSRAELLPLRCHPSGSRRTSASGIGWRSCARSSRPTRRASQSCAQTGSSGHIERPCELRWVGGAVARRAWRVLGWCVCGSRARARVFDVRACVCGE